jgi:nicotinate-nucleotide adenylyltransferase
MRVGILGGTFDPIHLGHLILAERCRDEANLDEVWFVPSHQPPHKPGTALTRFDHRCDMALLATTGQPLFRVETIEKELPPPSYTAETLAALHRRHPEHEYSLIVGADCLPDFATWHQPARVLDQAGLIVVPRPGFPMWSADRLAESLGLAVAQVRLTQVDSPLIEIASRDIRRRVAAGKSVRFLVPRSVEEFIRERRLYRVQ